MNSDEEYCKKLSKKGSDGIKMVYVYIYHRKNIS
jgi:hypothetical protein